MSVHTKEPWRVQKGFLTIYALSDGDIGVTTAIAKPLSHQVEGGEKDAEANARRIVACVNACTGISTEDLESVTGTGFPAQKLIDQRDELLAALRELTIRAENEIADPCDVPEIVNANSVLAKADLTQ